MSEPLASLVGNCPYCGESEWQNHRFCLRKALLETNEATENLRQLRRDRNHYIDELQTALAGQQFYLNERDEARALARELWWASLYEHNDLETRTALEKLAETHPWLKEQG